MTYLCKCGYEHEDSSFIITKRDPIFNKDKLLCARCGRRIFVKTVSPKEYKQLISNF